ncbi:hypothetical protein INT47_012798 [Mucor saturninus]|uniref:PHD-type domain-containing protein n=1 Tax=Mucor saturninus TaxID=64648 RepID=A0A8H7QQ99_9FUNG|nr:hypothetical protein INT47_012798 [Mucor saturninus]
MKKRSKSPTLNMQSRSNTPDSKHPKRNHSSIATAATKTKSKAAITMDMRNHDVCDSCGETGQFLCCDACPNAFHFTCVEPPMNSDDVAKLKEKWYCTECELKQNIEKRKIAKPATSIRGIFENLAKDIAMKNPKAYRLPNDIVNFFKGVASDKLGRYVDTTKVKSVRYRNGLPDRPDYHQLTDRNGKFRLCYYCRKTALKKPMVSCDFCPLYWHLDCLNPPLAIPPNPAKKWRCPNHIENFIKTPREPKNATQVTINRENPMPSSAYHHHLSQIVQSELNDNHHVDSKSKLTRAENIITSKTGIVYRLPVNPIQADISSHTKRRSSIPSTTASSSSSEVNTPPIFESPIQSHKPISHSLDTHTSNNNNEEIEAWLQSMALLQAGNQHSNDDQSILTLIRAATQTSPPLSPTPSRKRKSVMPSQQYEKYRRIEQLLQSKTEEQLFDLFRN